MPTRLIRLFLLAASLSFTGAAMVALSGIGLVVRPTATNMVAAKASAPIDPLSTTLMPIVMVRPEVEIPTLATVTVRPNGVERASIAEVSTNVKTAASMPPLASRPTAGMMASAGFDMPYYSFGKPLRHVSKE